MPSLPRNGASRQRLRAVVPRRRTLGAWLLATAAAALLGSVVQTQVNLQDIERLGVAVPWRVRLATTAWDLVAFPRAWAPMLLVAFAVAFPPALRLSRDVPRARMPLLAIAAATGAVVAVKLVDALAPMPTLIAATRHWPGLLLLAASAGIGGLVFARLRRPR
ncbi:hypothetical protein [Coralloluteibacterium stylophorae]|uniref:Uncharacterized protein n=1 Tax=Coralloluteibacterium stylophorae TaxID=1776034 RepID=A0A8J7VYC1_9GAMM|nr:hypothetical protein [Coralloluteibacterium stylophorae]MBS7458078.1 hypothetical protein [Coralloluteibacterium stylophorae]